MTKLHHLTRFGRLFPLLLTLALLLSSLTLPVSAGYTLHPLDEDDYSIGDTDQERVDYAKFTYNSSTGTITAHYPAHPGTAHDTDQTLTYAPHPAESTDSWNRLTLLSRDTRYAYYNNLTIGGSVYTINSPAYADDLLFVRNQSDNTLIPFFTESGIARLNALLEGTSPKEHLFRTHNGSYGTYNAVTSQQVPSTWTKLLAELDHVTETDHTLTRTLRDLRFEKPAVLYALGESAWTAFPLYYVFEWEETTYILPADTLEDGCFSSNGELDTTRADSVTLYAVNETVSDCLSRLRTAASPENSDIDVTYESQDVYLETDVNYDVLIIPSVVFSGILLPIAPIAVGFALGFSKKRPHRRRWRWLGILGCTWLVLGVLLLLLMI